MGIHRLSVQLANQIAAGEVVERQSSVVKELLENAVDAKADEIKCSIEAAGRVSISVTDNGVGIPCDELELALAPHATSKIATTEDLENIETLGFRGEALASIASVTKLTLTSRTKEEQDGYQVSCEGPQMEASVIPSPHGIGTTVEARELFFNTPARRRFLRSDRTELGRIKDVFIRCALSHPEISFELISDNKSLIKVRKAMDETARLKRMASLAGGEFAKDGIVIKSDDPLLQIDGIGLSGGDSSQGGTEKIFLFLNGRPVADKTIVHAVREAYSDFYGAGQSARCVLYLRCSPHECDVNVHPRKDEVRFHHARDVHDLISQTLLQAFSDFKAQNTDKDLLGLDDDMAVMEHVSSIKPVSLDLENPEQACSSDQMSFPSGLGGFFNKRNAKPNIDENLNNQSLDSDKRAPASSAVASDNAVAADFIRQEQESCKRNQNFQNMTTAHAKALRAQLDYSDENALEDIHTDPANNVATKKPDVDIANKQSVAVALDQVILERMSKQTIFIRRNDRYLLVNLPALKQYEIAQAYATEVLKDAVVTYKLNIPFALRPNDGLIKALKKTKDLAKRCGFTLDISRNQVSVLTVPVLIKNAELSSLCSKAFAVIAASDELTHGRCPKTLSSLLAKATLDDAVCDSEVSSLLAVLNDELEQNRSICRVLDIKKAVVTFEEQI